MITVCLHESWVCHQSKQDAKYLVLQKTRVGKCAFHACRGVYESACVWTQGSFSTLSWCRLCTISASPDTRLPRTEKHSIICMRSWMWCKATKPSEKERQKTPEFSKLVESERGLCHRHGLLQWSILHALCINDAVKQDPCFKMQMYISRSVFWSVNAMHHPFHPNCTVLHLPFDLFRKKKKTNLTWKTCARVCARGKCMRG